MGPRGMGASTPADPPGSGFGPSRMPALWVHAQVAFVTCAPGRQHLRQPHVASAETIGCDARTGTSLTMAGPSLSANEQFVRLVRRPGSA
jgi:hypothetical protein